MFDRTVRHYGKRAVTLIVAMVDVIDLPPDPQRKACFPLRCLVLQRTTEGKTISGQFRTPTGGRRLATTERKGSGPPKLCTAARCLMNVCLLLFMAIIIGCYGEINRGPRNWRLNLSDFLLDNNNPERQGLTPGRFKLPVHQQ
eukprot:scaffold143_cov133-Cylindrotheca_fusiformis.AAC.3